MKKWSLPTIVVGCGAAGAFLGSMYRHQTLLALWLAAMVLACIAIYFFVLPEDERGGDATVAAPVRRHATYAAPVYGYNAPTGNGRGAEVLAHAQAYAGLAAERTIEAAYEAYVGFWADPRFWTGVILASLAIFSGVGGMLDWWSLWKGLHLAGVFALMSAGFFLVRFEKVEELWVLVSGNRGVVWLAISVVGFLVTLLHKNWPQGLLCFGFFLSSLAALVTIFEKWPQVRAFLGDWLFQRGLTSLFIWLGLAVAALFAFFSPALLFGKAVTAAMGAVAMFYAVGVVILIVVGLTLMWRRL